MRFNREYVRAVGIALRNLIAGTNLRSLRHLVLRGPQAMLSSALETGFLERAMFADRGFPERYVVESLPRRPDGEPPSIRLHFAPEEKVWSSGVTSFLADLVALCMLARATDARIVFEIGTLRGLSTYHFAMNTGASAQIFSLDLPQGTTGSLTMTTLDYGTASKGRPAQHHFTGTPEERKIQLLFGDSATFDYSPWRRKVDLFFIDGAHSYDYVRSDTQRAFDCIKPGGVIAWHDAGRTGVNGVTKWLRELRARGHDICIIPGGSLAYLVTGDAPEFETASDAPSVIG